MNLSKESSSLRAYQISIYLVVSISSRHVVYVSSSPPSNKSLFHFHFHHINFQHQHVVIIGQSMTSEKNIIDTDGDDDYWMMVHLNLAIMLFNSTG